MHTARRFLLCSLCILCLIVVFVQSSAAQATITYARLNGTVQDDTEQVLVGAAVTLRNTGTNRSYEAMSNDTGTYVLVNLPPGSYEMSISYEGF
ncbi:MAG: carboxypeptidase-like regulatory domain-containing protein, partial [Acidobacteriota bacterium]